MRPAQPTSATSATLALGLGTLVSHGFGLALVPAFLPGIEDTFQSGFTALGGAVGLGLLTYATGGFLASRVLDWLPNRTVLNTTFVLTAIALLGAAVAPSATIIALPVMLLGLAAPISWAATTHVAARSVDAGRRGLVMGGASAGVGLGVIVNGGLVRLYSDPGAWRSAFLVAGVISLLVTVSSLLVFRHTIERPSEAGNSAVPSGSYREVLSHWAGRVVVVGSAIAGVTSYTFTTFLTATAFDTMGASATAAGALFWLMGSIGIVASISLGRLGDRRSPTLLVAAMFLVAGIGFGILTSVWSYPALALASLSIAILNYPIWGMVATVATNRFDASAALTAVSMGLVGASSLSAIASLLAGSWFDRVGSMRIPIGILAVLAIVTGGWLLRVHGSRVAD